MRFYMFSKGEATYSLRQANRIKFAAYRFPHGYLLDKPSYTIGLTIGLRWFKMEILLV